MAALQAPSRRGLLTVEQTGDETKVGHLGSWLEFMRWAVEYSIFLNQFMTMLCKL